MCPIYEAWNLSNFDWKWLENELIPVTKIANFR